MANGSEVPFPSPATFFSPVALRVNCSFSTVIFFVLILVLVLRAPLAGLLPKKYCNEKSSLVLVCRPRRVLTIYLLAFGGVELYILAGLLLPLLLLVLSCLLVCRGQRFLDLGGWLAIRGLAQKPPIPPPFILLTADCRDDDITMNISQNMM